MKRLTLLALGLAALLLGWWGLSPATHPSAAAERASVPAQDSETDARDREIADLKTRLARLEAEQRKAAGARSAAQSAPDSREEQPAGDTRPPEVLEREAEIAEWMKDHYTPEVQANVFGMYFADVDRVRTAETPDEGWRESIERGLGELLAGASDSIGEAEVTSLECGGTLCRIKIDVDKPAERGRLVHVMQRALHLDEASVYMPTSGTTLEGYFARAGSTLPQFDQLKYVGAEMDRIGTAMP